MRRRKARRSATLFGVLALALGIGLAGPQTARAAPRLSEPVAGSSSGSATASLDEALGGQWWTSRDLAVESTSDSGGFHLYLASGSAGFTWQPLATLKPSGFDTGEWTGYACLTGSGRHVVAVVAPSAFANSPVMRDRGALSYVVDVPSGTVHPLVAGVALKYYSPGCGASDSAVLTRNLGSDQQSTQLLIVDAPAAKITSTVLLRGQITNAVPAPGGTLAAAGSRLVRITPSGAQHTVATLPGQVYDIAAQADGTAGFLVAGENSTLVYSLRGGRAEQAARAPLADTRLFSGRAGRTLLVARSLTGSVPASLGTAVTTGLPDSIDGVSMDGQIVFGHRTAGATDAAGALDVRAVRTHRSLPYSAALGSAGPVTNGLPATVFGLSSSSPTTVSPNAVATRAVPLQNTTPACAVARNSPVIQVPQPGAKQVERAVDLAVAGKLNDQRPGNYLNMGLAAYSPGSDFPPDPLFAGGSVPPQVYLGILAQESNFDQASWHALPGIAGNPLIADYYGSGGTLNVIDYDAADCGYGIGQVTTGMKAADGSPYSAHGKLKIAVDYEENIAGGLQILEDKWNFLRSNGITVNGADPRYVENWYLAIWAYNTGVQPDAAHGNTTGCTPGTGCTDSAGNWGLGWANNPMNPDYNPGRQGFLRETYADAAHPGDWPYQERVLGWIEHPQLDYQGDAEYAGPDYGSQSPTFPGVGTVLSLAPYDTFCVVLYNHCDPNDSAKQYCQYNNPSSAIYDHCWWHYSASWVPDCSTACAVGSSTYAAGSADPGVSSPHPPDCHSSLPASAVIVDDLATPTQNIVGCTGSNMNWHTSGTFGLTEGTDASGVPLAVIDTHQLGAGFGGHLYFTHNIVAADTAHLVTGTWTVALPNHLYNVYVHMPSTGGTTDFAHYKITGADGAVYDRIGDQHTSADQWSSLGYFQLSSNAKVTLDNVTEDRGLGEHDVAYDAIAFVPVSGNFQHHTFDAVSTFDQAQNLDTTTPSVIRTPVRTMQTLYDWATDRTLGGAPWYDPSKPRIKGLLEYPACSPGVYATGCVGSTTLAAMRRWSALVQQAGTSTSGPVTEATWMSLNSVRPRPGATPDQAFPTDLDYKIKTHVDMSFAVDAGGKIVPGSEGVTISTRTGNTHLPAFITEFMQSTAADYGTVGVVAPDLSYDEIDANTYTGDATHVANPVTTGFTPGRAYMPHVSGAAIDSTGACVQAKSISGGTIGYRPLDAQSTTDAKVKAWVDELQAAVNTGLAPQEVADTAGDIYNTFFRAFDLPTLSGSLYDHAPPIWQEVSLAICANGTAKSAHTIPDADANPPTGIEYTSYMPDVYLYFDGHTVDNIGAPSSSPIQKGNFKSFSTMPIPIWGDTTFNPFDKCDTSARGSGGNPWNLSVPPLSSPDDRPKFVIYCDDHSWFDDTRSP